MSRSNTFDLVGLVGRYSDVGVPCVYPDLMMKLVTNKLVRSEFLELVLRNVDTRQQIKRMSQGTSGSMVKISAGGIVKLLVRIPNLPEQDRLLSIFTAETANIQALEREKAKLRLLKQGLMDDLLTGRVRVPVGSVPGA
jgi:type I restriction enzyme S subunit